MKCRHCSAELILSLIDLGSAPPSNAYLNDATLHDPEKWFPLRVLVCEQCWLAQTEDFAQAHELFDSDYAYFSSFSSGWLAHAERYVAEMVERFGLTESSHVLEVAANDGYLLQYVQKRNIPCTGIEPTASTAAAARNKGLEVIEDFFGTTLARQLVDQGKQADLTTANNVLAHVPDINDFIAGFSLLLKSQGVATFEFPHLLRLIEKNQFDTIYHEHFSYLSLSAVQRVFNANGLAIFDIEKLTTHGGSLRVFAQRKDTGKHALCVRVGEIVAEERQVGMETAEYYADFQTWAERVKDDFVAFLIEQKRAGKKVAAYGAAAKGNTLLNFAGIRSDLIHFVVDRNPAKQGKFLPGSRIPILLPNALHENKPDFVVIFPWNIAEEVIKQNKSIHEWGGKFVVAIPHLRILL